MTKSRSSESRIACVLMQVEEGTTVAEVRRKGGAGEATYYNRRKR